MEKIVFSSNLPPKSFPAALYSLNLLPSVYNDNNFLHKTLIYRRTPQHLKTLEKSEEKNRSRGARRRERCFIPTLFSPKRALWERFGSLLTWSEGSRNTSSTKSTSRLMPVSGFLPRSLQLGVSICR